MTCQRAGPSTIEPGLVAGQVRDLRARGMEIPDADFAARCLARIGYQRLIHYWSPLQSGPSPDASFQPDASASWLRPPPPPHRMEHVVERRPDCGTGLSSDWTHHTQEAIDLPQASVSVTEHAFIAGACPDCRRGCGPPAQLAGPYTGHMPKVVKPERLQHSVSEPTADRISASNHTQTPATKYVGLPRKHRWISRIAEIVVR